MRKWITRPAGPSPSNTVIRLTAIRTLEHIFSPRTYADGDLATEAANAWTDKAITVRYNPSHPRQSFFLEQDGAPAKPHIPRLLSWKPYVTDLSLK